MYCEQCGKFNENGKKYCYNCGSPLIVIPNSRPSAEKAEKNQRAVSHLAGADRNPSYYTKSREEEPDENKGQQQESYDDRTKEAPETVSERRRRTLPESGEEKHRRTASEKETGRKPAESEELKRLEKELHQLNKGKGPKGPKLALAGAILVLIAVLAVLVTQVPKLYGAEQTAANFQAAMLSGSWSEAYEYLYTEGETSDFVTEEMFETVMERSGASGFRNLTLQEVSSSDTQKIYSASYETSEGTASDTVIMYKTGEKKLLFLDEWKVDLSTVAASNVSVTIPSEAELILNGLSPEGEGEENAQEQTVTYVFDRLFTGIWEVQLTAENRADYVEDVEITEETADGIVSLASAELYPDQELMDAILAQFTSDYQAILESSVNRADFSEVEQYFAADAISEGRAQNMYANACSQAYDPETGSGILEYELSDISAEFVSTVKSGYAVAGDLVMKVHSTMTYTYMDEGVEKIETQTSEGLLCYHQENGEWKIQSFS